MSDGLYVPDRELVLPDGSPAAERDDLPPLTPKHRLAIEQEVDPERLDEYITALHARRERKWRETPSSMAAHLDPHHRRWKYVELLSDKFVDAVEGRSIRQCWSIPARMGKSRIGSRWGPVWALDRDPYLKLALVSTGDSLARDHSTWILDTIRLHQDDLRVRLKRDQQRHDRFSTEEGGGLMAVGIGSLLTGFGAHGIVEDDPFKDWQDAHSKARRDAVWNHYRSVVRLRLETEASFIIVIQTRWHEEDLIGLLEAADVEGDGEGWEITRIPAIAELPSTNSEDPPSFRAPDPLGRSPGEIIEPERFNIEEVHARARVLGSYLAAGLEQQRPAPEEGGEIKRGWWLWADDLPPRFDDSCTSWDLKMKDKVGGAGSSFVVGQVWGRTGSDFWLIDQFRGRWNFVTSKTAMVLAHVRYPWVRVHVVENKALGPEAIESLKEPQRDYVVDEEVRSELGITDEELPLVEEAFRRGLTGLLPDNPVGDKVARARAQTGKIEAGNVHLLRRPFSDALVNEAASFPSPPNDMVDTMTQALKRLSRPYGRPGTSASLLLAGRQPRGNGDHPNGDE